MSGMSEKSWWKLILMVYFGGSTVVGTVKKSSIFRVNISKSDFTPKYMFWSWIKHTIHIHTYITESSHNWTTHSLYRRLNFKVDAAGRIDYENSTINTRHFTLLNKTSIVLKGFTYCMLHTVCIIASKFQLFEILFFESLFWFILRWKNNFLLFKGGSKNIIVLLVQPVIERQKSINDFYRVYVV